MTTKKNNYWAKREKAERAWQIEQDKNFDKYVKELGEIYQKAIDNINREIRADIGIANGQLIKADKMAEYERLAKAMVKKADAMRAKGHVVTRKDFSKDVNDRLKIYNATMRVNRNEILKSMIGEQLVDLGIDQEVDLTKKLWNDYTKEKERQAGILGVTTKNKTWSNTDTAEIIYGQIANANFSKRIWANVDSLKGRLDGLVSTAIIRGDNPKEMAKWLTGEVGATIKNQRYVAERLARSETARVQFSIQKMSALDNGYKYVKWYAEGSACKACKAIVGDDVGYGDGIYPVKEVPDIPVHPNCMCSVSAYWVEDKKNTVENDESVNKDLQTIIDGLQQSDFTYTYGKEISTELANKINGLNPEQRQMYINNLKNVKFVEPTSDGAYVSDKIVRISKSDLMDNKTENKFGVFFHETAHAFDVPKPLAKGKMPTLDDVLNPSQKVGLAESTLDDFKRDVYKDIPDLNSLGKRPRRNSKAYAEWNDKYMALVDKRRKAEDVFDKEIDELKKLPVRTRANLSDMIESADDRLGDYKWSHSPLGMGHSQKDYQYWKDKDIGNAESEFFAEVNSAVATNPESLELIKKYFPSSYKKYWEVVKLINK